MIVPPFLNLSFCEMGLQQFWVEFIKVFCGLYKFYKVNKFLQGLGKLLYFIKYIYWRFYLLYLILLILLIKQSFSLSTLTSGGGSQICLGRASNTGVVGQRTDIWNTGWILTVLGSFNRQAYGEITFSTLQGPAFFQLSFLVGRFVFIFLISNQIKLLT